jgi:hypothetical protein
MPSPVGEDDEFLTVARQAVASSDGETALASLGWWELLSALDDPELRPAVYAVFRAQGGALRDSPALGGLLAQPYLDGSDHEAGSVVATVRRHSPARGEVFVLVGPPAGRRLLLDRPGVGATVIDSDAATLRPIEVPGGLTLHEIELEADAFVATIDEPAAAIARERSRVLGRVAISSEILGAAEGALTLAVDYAGQREQFGQPIGGFQAVRHLLAWATTDCVALAATTTEAVRLDRDAPPGFDSALKALAGRNGRRACERSLQVLGGIGFTTELDHHHFHSRVLALDALLGSAAALTRQIGADLREGGEHPGFPEAVLLAGG